MSTQFVFNDRLLLDKQIDDDERVVQEAAHQYAQRALAPRVLEDFRNERTDPAIFREMGELGLLGVTIPTEFGGAGLNYVRYGLVAREIERVDSGYRSMMSVQSSLVMVPINEVGTLEQKQKYLPGLTSGQKIGCFGLTEPNHGSDPNGMTTRARKVDGGYSLTGSKMWITNSPIADVLSPPSRSLLPSIAHIPKYIGDNRGRTFASTRTGYVACIGWPLGQPDIG
jgi:glutaryl-CoA dehydrogenase